MSFPSNYYFTVNKEPIYSIHKSQAAPNSSGHKYFSLLPTTGKGSKMYQVIKVNEKVSHTLLLMDKTDRQEFGNLKEESYRNQPSSLDESPREQTQVIWLDSKCYLAGLLLVFSLFSFSGLCRANECFTLSTSISTLYNFLHILNSAPHFISEPILFPHCVHFPSSVCSLWLASCP